MGLVASLVALGTALLLAQPDRVLWDQQLLIEDSDPYPVYGDGVVSELFVRAVRGLPGLDPGRPNPGVRIAALALYLASAAWLGAALLGRAASLVAFLLLLFASRQPFVWISSELIAGALVCVSILAVMRWRSPALVGAVLALTAFSKPDLPVIGLALLVYAVARETEARRRIAAVAAFAAVAGGLVLPGLLQHGRGFFDLERSFISFSQHYAALAYEPDPDAAPQPVYVLGSLRFEDPRLLGTIADEPLHPWLAHASIRERELPGAESVADVVRTYPLQYLAFVARSAARSFEKIALYLDFLLIGLALRFVALARGGPPPSELERVACVLAVGLVPLVLLSFVHVRYLARFLPALLLVLLAFVESRRGAPRLRRAVAACLVLALVLDTATFVDEWRQLEPQHVFWFPD